jgi:hypothetical protein
MLLAVVLAGVVLACTADDAWEAKRQAALNRKREVLYNTDGCDAVYYPRQLAGTKENFIVQRIANTKNSRVDTVLYNPLASGFCHLTTRTNAGDRLYIDPPHTPELRNVTRELHALGTDPLKLTEEFCKENGLEFFASMRMNDVHDCWLVKGMLQTTDNLTHPQALGMHAFFPPWKAEHPEFLFGAPDRLPPYGPWSAVDYDRQEVRDRMLACLKEFCTEYDIDGLELDFTRMMCYFKTVAWGAIATPEQCDLMTGFIAAVRAVAEEAGRQRGRPILLAVRATNSIEYNQRIGLDLKAWFRQGMVDIFIGDNWVPLDPWKATAALAHRYKMKFYASLDSICAGGFGKETGNYYALYYGWTGDALSSGADGICYFNVEEPTLFKSLMLGRLEDVIGKDKVYITTSSESVAGVANGYLRDGIALSQQPVLLQSVPRVITPETPCRMTFVLCDDLSDPDVLKAAPTVVATLRSDAPADDRFTLVVNRDTYPEDSRDGDRVHFRIRPASLKKGENSFAIRLASAKSRVEPFRPILAGDHLLSGSQQPPWRRIFDIQDFSTAEKIVEQSYCLTDDSRGKSAAAGLLYPLPNLPGPRLRFAFELKVGETTAPEAVVVRAANGHHIELITFEPETISFKFARKSVPFRTGDAFHRYEVLMQKKTLKLFADGSELCSVPLVMRADDPAGRIQDATEMVPRMHDRSLYFGSISGEGTSVSYWKAIRLVQDWSQVTDFRFAITFPKTLSKTLQNAASAEPEWVFSAAAKEGKVVCSTGVNNSYRDDLFQATADNTISVINDDPDPRYGYCTIGPNDPSVIDVPRELVVAEWRMRVTAGEQDTAAFIVYLAPLSRPGYGDRNTWVKVALDKAYGSFDFTCEVNPQEWNTYRLALDPTSGEVALWINGKLAGFDAAKPDKEFTRSMIYFGDGSGGVKGRAELAYFKVGELKY